MEECLSYFRLMKLRFSSRICYSSNLNFFVANSLPDPLCLHLYTQACAPSPIFSSKSYFSRKELRGALTKVAEFAESLEEVSSVLVRFSNRFVDSFLEAYLFSISMLFLLMMVICFMEERREFILYNLRFLLELNGTFYIKII